MNNLAFDNSHLYDRTQSLSDGKEKQFNIDDSGEENIFQKEEPQKMKSDSTNSYFPENQQVQIEARRQFNRAISSKISNTAKDQLFKERLHLVDKKFNTVDGLTKKESKKLALIDWKLDRIEDAECGEELDRLAAFVAAQEQHSQNINNFIDNLSATGRNIIRKKNEK